MMMKNRNTFQLLSIFFVFIALTIACNQEDFMTDGFQSNNEMAFDESKLITYESEGIPGQYIVVMKNDPNASRAKLPYNESQKLMLQDASLLMQKNRLKTTNIVNTYSATIRGFLARVTEAEARKLAMDEEVAYVEQDQLLQLAGGPPGGGGGSCADGNSEMTPCGIGVVNGGGNYTGSSVAWVIDTGIDLDHPDLNVDASRGFVASSMRGRDARSADDLNGHGSHVAGTIAAIGGNGIGVVGVAAGATVIPVKVLDSRGSGTNAGVIEGVDYVGANGSAGDVANMSLGGGVSQALDDAVVNASSGGIWFSLAAGNSSADANNSSPARANGPYVRTISAMDCSGNWASFSNYGNPPVDYAAPGVSVCSTYKSGGYASLSGTSMAAPHAAGVLLATAGNANTCGTVSGDPDGTPDPIICQ